MISNHYLINPESSIINPEQAVLSLHGFLAGYFSELGPRWQWRYLSGGAHPCVETAVPGTGGPSRWFDSQMVPDRKHQKTGDPWRSQENGDGGAIHLETSFGSGNDVNHHPFEATFWRCPPAYTYFMIFYEYIFYQCAFRRYVHNTHKPSCKPT